MKFKAITFIVNLDIVNGHYFYNVTMTEALTNMKEKGIDPTSMLNIKMNIACYYY